jgi:hypothetical protein
LNKLISISLFLFFTLSCNSTKQLRNDWVVIDKQIQISKDWEYLLEIDSTLIVNKFNRQFPNQLEIGDQIKISKDLIMNKDKSYSYYLSDSSLCLRHTDVIHSLKYRLMNNKMEIYREIPQGIIKRKLNKNES